MKTEDIEQSAVFSECGRYRHLLLRTWDKSLPVLPFLLLNPSVAGKRLPNGREEEDPTSRKGIGFAERLGYGGMAFTNLYDWCATDPKDLKRAGYPISLENHRYIRRAAEMGDGGVICGWGANARGLGQPMVMIKLLRAWGFIPKALRLLSDGTPEHPLMLPYTCKPMTLQAGL